MLHHVSVGVRDVATAAPFYDRVLGALGYRRVLEVMPYGIGYGDKVPAFWVQLPHDQSPASVGNGTHVGFIATSKAAIEEFYRAALAAGGTDNGPPGPRPNYGPSYFGAFVCDPEGNKLEAVLVESPPARRAVATKKKRATKKRAKKSRAAGRSKAKRATKKSKGRRRSKRRAR
jgi:catechol 2,3-dioxygenase-like lactoylglutathione lyase family enzyme